MIADKFCKKCGKKFTPKRAKQMYCSHQCSVRPGWGYGGGIAIWQK